MKVMGFVMGLFAVVATGCGAQQKDVSFTRSLTGDDFAGKKYYLGWGAAGSGDPSNMHNEVKYDVLHTHDIFTAQVGGNYIGTKDTGSAVRRATITNNWQRLRSHMTADDMFVQYSSGHGSPRGLEVGVSYDEIRDNALSLPAKEVIIFTMACYSGNLVDSFNRARSQWQSWGEQGRTLLVMASSPSNQSSSTGPGRDTDEPNGPYGSAGSAYGHALWKSLLGYADGYVDGVKDGYISLEEIVEYTKMKTRQIGGHMPQVTGVYNKQLVMNRVPPRSFLESLEGSTEGLTDEEVMRQVQELDAEMRLQ